MALTIISPATVAENTTDNQLLLFTLNQLVSTSVKWTPHAPRHSCKKSAQKLALTTYLSVSNLFDRDPPPSPLPTTTFSIPYSGAYDTMGRAFTLGVRATF
ncbi:MAG: hypothetical protein ACOVN0_10070 [Niveispirillum sp.]|uniref:hypothetical protein n=1 Tax=Niveispirillum sp. TaxID=1917217 RepID=UPI003BA7E7C7